MPRRTPECTTIGFAIFGDDCFGLDVQALSDFVGSCFAESAFADDVCGHRDWLAVGEGLKAGIERLGGASQLDVERSREEERAQSEARCEPLASGHEVQACDEKCYGCGHPP